MASGLLFDLDGTLLDTAPDFEICLNQLLQEDGKQPLPFEVIRQVVSSGARGLIKLGFNIDVEHADYERLKNRLLDGYETILGQKTSFFPGIESLLMHLKQNDIPWGIVTNKPERFTFPLLETIKFPNAPQCVICADTLEHAKPHPLPISHGCKLLKVEANKSLYVGDDHRDVLSSNAAGLDCCVVHYGYIHASDDPLKWDAQHYVSHADEILPIFEKMQ